jgi:site-specific recombinase XerD
MDKGRGYTELVLRKMNNESLCPLRNYTLLQRRARRVGADGSLFCSKDGKPYAQSAQLSSLLKQLLGRAGIDRKNPAYSIRHA